MKLGMFFIIFNIFSFELKYQGEVNFEKREFRDDNVDITKEVNNSVSIMPQFEVLLDEYSGKAAMKLREDFNDSDRNQIFIQDFWGGIDKDNFTIRLGYQIFDWSTLDIFNPRDILNSKELDGNLESLNKRGELAFRFEYLFENSSLELLYLPRFEDPIIPGKKNRLGNGVDISGPVIQENSDKETLNPWAHQFAIKYDISLESSDLSFSFIDHVDRDSPLVKFVTVNDFIPIYFRKRQLGASYQFEWQTVLFKFQGVSNNFYEKKSVSTLYGTQEPINHRVLASGIEYGLEFSWGHELSLFFEWQRIFGVNKEQRSRLSSFQNDYYIGLRYDLNDIQSTSFTVNYISDLERNEQHIVNFILSRRLAESWKAQISGRYIDAPPREKFLFLGLIEIDNPKGIEVYHRDNQFIGSLSYFY